MSVETALSYAALILADSEIEISSDKLLSLTNAANVPVEGIWADIFSRALEAQNLKDLLVNFSAGASVGGVAGVAGGASGEAAGEGEEEKEEEAKEESDDDMGFGLFD